MFVVGVSALLAGLLWIAANEVLALNKPDKTVEITVEETDTVASVADKLKDIGVINYKWLFNFYGSVSHAQEKIKPGTYEINTNYDYMAIVNALRPSAGRRETVSVVIPEGFTLQQIVNRLVENKVCTMEDLKDVIKNYDFANPFVKDLPKTDNRLEGYLFPDTYEFYVGDKAANVIGKMLSQFTSKITPDMEERAAELGFSMHEVVTIASLIEKEAANADEAPYIASVIHNRLKSDKFPRLQIDATVIYALPEHKERLTEADLQIDSPYNTYLYDGLPPGPIASPGRTSLAAALYPESTSYYYYAINKDGVHQFSKTKQEHDRVVAAARAAAAAG